VNVRAHGEQLVLRRVCASDFLLQQQDLQEVFMNAIFSVARSVATARPMSAWAGPVIFFLLFLASLIYVSLGGTMMEEM
jgi:hypothetical protein